MSDQDDELPTSEPVITGFVQMQLSGHIPTAQSHRREARHILGQMLENYGVNKDLSAGMPTGFFRTQKELDDGTRVTAWHNNGHNVLRIESHPVSAPKEERELEYPEAQAWVGQVENRPGKLAEHQGEHPDIPRRSREVELEEDELLKKRPPHYLWVGIKAADGVDCPWYALHAIMVEPDAQDAEGQPLPRGWVGSSLYWETAELNLEFDDDDVASLVTSDYSWSVSTFAEAMALLHEDWAEWQPLKTERDHSVLVYDNTHGGNFTVSANGLRCFAVANYFDGQGFSPSDDPDRWMPFDPLLPLDMQNGDPPRVFGDRRLDNFSGGSYDIPERKWDVVFVLDSEGEEQFEPPSDPRPHINNSRKVLEDEAGMASYGAIFLPGEYKLAVHLVDGLVEITSRRAGEEIPLAPEFYRSGFSDYENYMYTPDDQGTENVEVEIEVRIGKLSEMATFNFVTTIAEGDDRFTNTVPFGYGADLPGPFCTTEGGPNPHGPNFSDVLSIDVLGGRAEWASPSRSVLPGLGGGLWMREGDSRRPLDIYVFGGTGVSQVDNEYYGMNAGIAVWSVMEFMTSGSLGRMQFNEFTEGQIAQAFASATHDPPFVYRFDPVSGSVTPLPLISGPFDWDYDDYILPGSNPEIILPSGFKQHWYWYYPYKLQSKAQCRNSVAILLAAHYGGFIFESGQHVLRSEFYQEPAPPDDCC
jgi:hypothetical protein